jgi:WD40 repeat protein
VHTAGEDPNMQIWDAASGNLEQTKYGHTNLVTAAAYSLDGCQLVIATVDGTARLWAPTGGTLLPIMLGTPGTGAIYSVAFSPDGTIIVAASGNGVLVWDVQTGQTRPILGEYHDSASSAVFSPNGQRILVASGTMAVLWDTAANQELALLADHTQMVYTATFSRDGLLIVTASADGTARIWDAILVE